MIPERFAPVLRELAPLAERFRANGHSLYLVGGTVRDLLVADGKTVQDAALLMELNPATVEKHLRLAREALEVETTAQAIRKVSTHNQFFLFPRE